MNREEVAAVLREEFEKEERSRFARISTIPDTSVLRFLHYYRTLDATESARLKTALASCGAGCFVPLESQISKSHPDPVLKRCQATMARLGEWKFNSLKLLKMMIGYMRSEHPAVRAQVQQVHVPDEVIRWVDSLTTCKAPELRKLVKLALQTRFGLKPENHGGGVWLYKHPANEQPFHVEIDYGGTWGQQMRYEVHIDNPQLAGRFRGITYESLTGFGAGDWDFVTTGNADQSVALLTDLIEDTVELSKRILSPSR